MMSPFLLALVPLGGALLIAGVGVVLIKALIPETRVGSETVSARGDLKREHRRIKAKTVRRPG